MLERIDDFIKDKLRPLMETEPKKWDRLVKNKIRLAEEKQLPTRFVDRLTPETPVYVYISIDKKVEPYTVIFFQDIKSVFLPKTPDVSSMHAVVLQKGQPLKIAVKKREETEWNLPAQSPKDPIVKFLLDGWFNSLKDAQLINPSIEDWHNRHLDASEVIKSVSKYKS